MTDGGGAFELLDRFADPGGQYGPLPLWWWSGATVTRPRLRWQMQQLMAQGVRQAVVYCIAPTGPVYGSHADDPPFLSPRWIELLDGACEDARELGFQLWIYDQIGDPTGSDFQERLVAEEPRFAGLALHRRPGGEIEQRVSGFDYFGMEAGAALLDQVHGELERQVGRWFGTAIAGFYQDELPWMPTWGHDFAETFLECHGYDLLPQRSALFEGSDPESARIRRDYHAHRARLARRAFFDPLAAWFDERGLLCGFDQGTPAKEGDPIGGALAYGDYLGTHAGLGAPGTDHWGDAKVHSSLAHTHGHARTWIEAFHQSGWGGTLEETYDWLAPFLRRGANLYNPHAVYYSTVGGWWEFAPPSTCWRQPYWPSYHQFATAVARLCSVLTAGTHVCDVVLLFPTATAQAYLTIDGRPLPPAKRAAERYHELNGVSRWFAEERGILDRAGVDYDILDESTVASGEIVADRLQVGTEAYRTVVLPGVEVLDDDTADRLETFAGAGGRVVCVGTTPSRLAGHAIELATGEQLPDVVRHGPVRVEADAPFLLRRHGDAHVLLLTAHDELSGTHAPIVQLDGGRAGYSVPPWRHGEYTKELFAEVLPQLRSNGYRFVPGGDRCARVQIHGLVPRRAQRWDPRTGRRTELEVRCEGDALVLDVPFEDGPVALVVLGAELPEATGEPPRKLLSVSSLSTGWRACAQSTLENRDGDLAAVARDGILPIEVWRLQHSTSEGWRPVIAGYGPFAEARDPDGHWRPAEWSLSRGIHKDPVHAEVLGPRGYVPEEFLHWPHVMAGARVAVRTHLPLPQRSDLYLAVGSDAARRVTVDGTELRLDGEGYQSFCRLPATTVGRTVAVEVELDAERDGPLRASFAVVGDPASYRRPEWLVGSDMTHAFHLDEIPADATTLFASDGPCTLLVNGVQVGRQGGVDLYPAVAEVAEELLASLGLQTRVRTYDLRDVLVVGANLMTVRLGDGAAAALDTPGLGVSTGPGWEGATPRRHRGLDRRLLCARPRPHPLPGAHWLEPAAAPGDTVVPVVPDTAPGERTESLRFPAPLGTVGIRVPTDLEVALEIEGTQHEPIDGWVRLAQPLAAGTTVALRVRAVDGRRGGALLDEALEIEVAETDTTLDSWEDLGLRALGGQVRYRNTFRAASARVVLDLGEVRGTADVLVNGSLVDRLVWGPWRTELTSALRPGDNDLEVIVRGTLAGYVDDASPTPYVYAGQVRTGLFGPVRLLAYGSEE
jgi:hypothetical protein